MPKNLSKKYLRECLDYNPETGKLYWKRRPIKHFKDGTVRTAEQVSNSWNAKHEGKEAFTSINGAGYKNGRIDGINYQAHRVIYALMTGKWPKMVDHDNRKRSNNKWENLIPSNAGHNARNRKRQFNNKSGVSEVRKTKEGRWNVRISYEGKRIDLGTYPTKKKAVEIRKEAEIEYGYRSTSKRGSNG